MLWVPITLVALAALGSGGTRASAAEFATSEVLADTVPDSQHVLSGGRLYFSGLDDRGAEPWVSDGSPSGTHLIADLIEGAQGSSPRFFSAIDTSDALFVASDGAESLAVYRTTGGGEGATALVLGLSLEERVIASASLGVGVVFALRGGINAGLWITDGSLAPAQRLTSLVPAGLISHAGRVVFFTNDGLHGEEPWVTDGTQDGTRLLLDIIPGVGGSEFSGGSSREATLAACTVAFLGPGAIWTTDGTLQGTRFHTRVPGGDVAIGSPLPPRLGSIGPFAVFGSSTPTGGDEVSVLDVVGSLGIRTFDLAPGFRRVGLSRVPRSSAAGLLASSGAFGLFVGSDRTGNGQTWVLDTFSLRIAPLRVGGRAREIAWDPLGLRGGAGFVFAAPSRLRGRHRELWYTRGRRHQSARQLTRMNASGSYSRLEPLADTNDFVWVRCETEPGTVLARVGLLE